jgi:capsular polysaccharide biosynthesis protein
VPIIHVYLSWEVAMEITRLRQIINRYWWIVAASAIIVATAVLVYNLTQPPKYKAEMSFIIVPGSVDNVNGSDNPVNSVEALDKRSIAETFGEVARSSTVTAAADGLVEFNLTQMLETGQMEREISVVPSTNIIRVVVRGPKPGEAALAADAIGRAAQQSAANLRYPYALDVLDAVQVPERPEDSNLVTDALIGFMVGAFTGFGIALALDYLRQPGAEAKARRATITQ